MTEKEAADKLKARIGQWQAYVAGTPASPPTDAGAPPHAAPPAEAVVHDREDRDARPRAVVPDEVIPPDRVIAQCEAQIADLQAAVEREREQARKLAETLLRDSPHRPPQARRTPGPPPVDAYGPTTFSHLRSEAGHVGRDPRYAPGDFAPLDPDEYARHRRGMLLFCLLLLMAGVATLLSFFFIR